MDKGSSSRDQAYIKSGKALGTRLTFTKIKKNPDRPTLPANPGSGDGKQTIFLVQPKVNFKICDVIAWLTNNWNTHIVQYLEK